MSINLIATIVGIIAGIITIINFAKEVKKPQPLLSTNQQNNINGSNYSFKNTTNVTTIRNTTNNTTIRSGDSNSSNSNYEVIVYIICAIILSIILLSIYSFTYKILPALCLVLFSIKTYRDLRVPFEDNQAKNQWYYLQFLLAALLIILFILPKSILIIVNQIPPIEYETANALFKWFTNNGILLKDLISESPLSFYNILGRICVTMFVLIILTKLTFTKIDVHKTRSKKRIVELTFAMFLFFVFSNIIFFWNAVEPFRNAIETWFNSNPL